MITKEQFIAAAIKEDRREMFASLHADLKKVRETIAGNVVYSRALAGLRALDDIEAYITDPIGEYLGACVLCEEPLFEDDATDIGGEDDTIHAHKDCAGKLQASA